MKMIKKLKDPKWIYLQFLVISIAVIYVVFEYFFEFSAFAVTLGMWVSVIGLIALVDSILLKGINTLDEIKNGNTAVSQAYIAIAIAFLACALFV